MCAQALESARILLNSANERQPNGLANSSGALGHYLMDHLWVAGGAEGDFPDLHGTPALDGPKRPDGMYVIRFRNPHDGPKYPKFLRGYGFQGGASTGFNFGAPGFGLSFKQGVREPVTRLGLAGFGEVLPRFENFVEIDKSVVDVYGIPTLKIHMSWSDNERAMIPDMAESAVEMLEAAGAKNVQGYQIPDRIPGYGIHEMGVARMGTDKKTSVLNQYQQAHDVDNLFVMDGVQLHVGRLPEPDPHHHGPDRALHGLPAGRAEEEQPVVPPGQVQSFLKQFLCLCLSVSLCLCVSVSLGNLFVGS